MPAEQQRLQAEAARKLAKPRPRIANRDPGIRAGDWSSRKDRGILRDRKGKLAERDPFQRAPYEQRL